MATPLAHQPAFDTPSIPDRLYFKIGDVARLCEVESHVLRFWETQFPQLKPNKSGTGQRLYRKSDVEIALQIKQLVRGQGYTITGARQVLQSRQVLKQESRRTNKQSQQQSQLPLIGLPLAMENTDPIQNAASLSRAAEAIGQIRAELREIATQLAAPLPERLRPELCGPVSLCSGAPVPIRRRCSRLATVRSSSGLLFPAEFPVSEAG